MKSVRFSEYVHEISVQQNAISYKNLMPKTERDSAGKDKPYSPPKLRLKPMDIYKLLRPYVGIRFMDQLKAVGPLAVYLAIFQWLVLNESVQNSSMIGVGLFAVIVGLMLFMEGLKLGLMPFGEIIGNVLPRKAVLPVVLGIAFLLGVGVTFAEPAIGALQAAGKIVDVQKAPILFSLLTDRAPITVIIVGIGVGIAAVLGTMRFIYCWSLKPLIYYSLIPTMILTGYLFFDPEISKIIGLAWDCGAVTTGPVTVPLVLALGIGVASAVGTGGSTLSGFGIVTLASVFPILGVLLFGTYVGLTTSPDQIIAAAQALAAAQEGITPGWWEVSPGIDVVLGVRAIVPLVLFLLFVLMVVLREKLPQAGIIRYGIFLAVVGMCIFNVGLTYGLSELGAQSGGFVPGSFARIEGMVNSPLYGYAIGVTIAFLFAFLLGFGATLAEPALNALGTTVETLTAGAFKKSLLMYSVAFGVALGIAIGVLKIVFQIPLTYLIIPGYIITLVLTVFSTEEFTNIAWDSAGVTTGPVTVPLVLSMGLGFGKAVGVVEGFGILACASFCPIMAVLASGIYIQYKVKRDNKKLVSTSAQVAFPDQGVVL
jgi:hypothetical protein